MPFVKFTCLTAGPVLSVRPTLYLVDPRLQPRWVEILIAHWRLC